MKRVPRLCRDCLRTLEPGFKMAATEDVLGTQDVLRAHPHPNWPRPCTYALVQRNCRQPRTPQGTLEVYQRQVSVVQALEKYILISQGLIQNGFHGLKFFPVLGFAAGAAF